MPYYVTIRRGSRTGVLAGPFGTHDVAASYVDPVATVAETVDPWSRFDAFGVAYVPQTLAPGRMNARLGIPAGLTYAPWATS